MPKTVKIIKTDLANPQKSKACLRVLFGIPNVYKETRYRENSSNTSNRLILRKWIAKRQSFHQGEAAPFC